MTKDIRSDWPQVATDALENAMQRTPHGCGGCCHSDWIFFDKKWMVGVCRQGMKLEFTQLIGEGESLALAGYEPVLFCTAKNAGVDS